MAPHQHAYKLLCRLYRLVLNKQWSGPPRRRRIVHADDLHDSPRLEPLETRVLLSTTAVLVEPGKVLFQGDSAADSLYLRADHGVLEYSQTGSPDSYTADVPGLSSRRQSAFCPARRSR